MTTPGYERSELLSRLRQVEARMADALRSTATGTAVPDFFRQQGRWILWGAQGERVRRVQQALADSDDIALQRLQQRLGCLDMQMVWPLLKEFCQDIALYLGGSLLSQRPGSLGRTDATALRM